MNYPNLLIVLLMLLFFNAHGQGYLPIDAVTGASNIGKGDFQVTGGKAYADYAEIYFTFVQDLTDDISQEETSIKWGTTRDYSDGSLPLYPYVKLSKGTRVLQNLLPNTTYYYWIRGDYYFKGKSAWFDLKSSFVTFNNIVSLASIEISPRSAILNIGGIRQFSARAAYSDGSASDVSGTVAWSSLNVPVASVDTTGIVTGLAPGLAFILASIEGISDTIQVEIVSEALILDSCTITPASGTVGSNSSLQFSATGYYGNAGSQDISNTVTWSSSDTGIATVDSRGLAIGVSPGTVTISAEQDGLRADAGLTVTDPVTLAFISISPDSAVINMEESFQFSVTGTFSDGSTSSISSDLVWMVGDPSIADISGGMVYGLAPGQTEVIALYAGLFQSAKLKINMPEGVKVKDTSGRINIITMGENLRVLFPLPAAIHNLRILSPDGKTIHQARITGDYTWRNGSPGIYTIILENPYTGKIVQKCRVVFL